MKKKKKKKKKKKALRFEMNKGNFPTHRFPWKAKGPEHTSGKILKILNLAKLTTLRGVIQGNHNRTNPHAAIIYIYIYNIILHDLLFTIYSISSHALILSSTCLLSPLKS